MMPSDSAEASRSAAPLLGESRRDEPASATNEVGGVVETTEPEDGRALAGALMAATQPGYNLRHDEARTLLERAARTLAAVSAREPGARVPLPESVRDALIEHAASLNHCKSNYESNERWQEQEPERLGEIIAELAEVQAFLANAPATPATSPVRETAAMLRTESAEVLRTMAVDLDGERVVPLTLALDALRRSARPVLDDSKPFSVLKKIADHLDETASGRYDVPDDVDDAMRQAADVLLAVTRSQAVDLAAIEARTQSRFADTEWARDVAALIAECIRLRAALASRAEREAGHEHVLAPVRKRWSSLPADYVCKVSGCEAKPEVESEGGAALDLHKEPRFGCGCGEHASITYMGRHWFPAGHSEDGPCDPNVA